MDHLSKHAAKIVSIPALGRAAYWFELATPIAKAIPILGAPVEGSFEATAKILKFAQEVKVNKQKAHEIAEEAAQWLYTFLYALSEAQNDTVQVERLRAQVQEIYERLEDIAKTTEQWKSKSLPKRIWRQAVDLEELDTLQQQLKAAVERFVATSQIRIQTGVAAIREVVMSDSDRELLNSLDPAHSAHFKSRLSPPGCLPNTRTEIFSKLHKWAGSPSSKFSVYWLAGLAGTGKSSITKTFCEQVSLQGNQSLITFFASRSSSERRDPFRILYTFVYQLARAHLDFRNELLETLREHPDLKDSSMARQVDALLATPLATAFPSSSNFPRVLFVLDALDQCDKIGSMEGGTLIPDMACALKDLPCRLLVTSRNEHSLLRMFKTLPNQETFQLHTVDLTQVESDVSLIFSNGFSNIAYSLEIADSQWPDAADIQTLVTRTGRLMIFASTALNYIGDEQACQPQARLRQIVDQVVPTDKDASPYFEIDQLYIGILSSVVTNRQGKREQMLIQRMKAVLGVILVASEPPTVEVLASLACVPEQEVKATLRLLESVLLSDISETGSITIRTFHPSLRDFLMERCKDRAYRINGPEHHRSLSCKCLDVLNSGPSLNIYQAAPMPNDTAVKAIYETLVQRVGSSTLRYACRYWAEHLVLGVPLGKLLSHTLPTFASEHLVQWVEVSLSYKFATIHHIIDALAFVIRWCETQKLENNVAISFLETLSTLVFFWSVIKGDASKMSALHRYSKERHLVSYIIELFGFSKDGFRLDTSTITSHAIQQWLDNNMHHPDRMVELSRLWSWKADDNYSIPIELLHLSIKGVTYYNRLPHHTPWDPFFGTHRGYYLGQDVAIKHEWGRCNGEEEIPVVNANLISKDMVVSRNLEHPNILRILGITPIYRGGGIFNFAAVYPWMQHGNLMSYLDKVELAARVDEKQIISGIAAGLEYLHAQGLVHCDLNGYNVLIDNQLRPLIKGFEYAELATSSVVRQIPESESSRWRWACPEIILREDDGHLRPDGIANRKIDVFAFGRVCLSVFTRRDPFHAVTRDTEILLMVVMKHQPPDQPATMPNQLWNLITRCWRADPSERPTVDQVIGELNAILF